MFATFAILATMAAQAGEPATPKIVLRGNYTADAAKMLPLGDWRNYGLEGYTGELDWEYDPVPELAFDANGKPYLLTAKVGQLNVEKPLTTFRIEGEQIKTVEVAANEVILSGISPGKIRLVVRAKNSSKRLATLIIDVGPRGPPVVAPPVTGTPKVNYLAIIRADSPATSEYADIMARPEWDELRAKGVTVKDMTFDHATKNLKMQFPGGVTLPCVVRLFDEPAAKKSTRIGLPVPLNKSTDILKLIEVSP